MMNKNYYKFGWLKNLSNPIKSWKVGKRQKVRKGLKIWAKLLQSQVKMCFGCILFDENDIAQKTYSVAI